MTSKQDRVLQTVLILGMRTGTNVELALLAGFDDGLNSLSGLFVLLVMNHHTGFFVSSEIVNVMLQLHLVGVIHDALDGLGMKFSPLSLLCSICVLDLIQQESKNCGTQVMAKT